MKPVEYPRTAHERKHGPQGYASYRHFKPWLRDEFCFRCVYCLSREQWFPTRHASFAVDHFVPKSVNPKLLLIYDNLFYSCQVCNTLKGDEVLSVSPCSTALCEHLRLESDGRVVAQSPAGQEYIDVLLLNRKPLVDMRNLLCNTIPVIMNSTEPYHRQLLQLFCGFPDELPNLESPPRPQANTKIEGIRESYYMQRLERRLPAFY